MRNAITARDTRPGPEYVSKLIVVKNVSAPQLVPILRPLVRSYPESPTLLIVDRFENVRRLEGLIQAIDSGGSAHARPTRRRSKPTAADSPGRLSSARTPSARPGAG